MVGESSNLSNPFCEYSVKLSSFSSALYYSALQSLHACYSDPSGIRGFGKAHMHSYSLSDVVIKAAPSSANIGLAKMTVQYLEVPIHALSFFLMLYGSNFVW